MTNSQSSAESSLSLEGFRITRKWSLSQNDHGLVNKFECKRRIIDGNIRNRKKERKKKEEEKKEKWCLWCLYVGSIVFKRQRLSSVGNILTICPLKFCLMSPQMGEWALNLQWRQKGPEVAGPNVLNHKKLHLAMVVKLDTFSQPLHSELLRRLVCSNRTSTS